MGRPPKEPPTVSPLPPAILRLVRARGADAQLVADRLGLPANAESLEEAALTPDGLEELLDAAARLLGEPNVGLALPAQLVMKRYTLPELVVRSAPTVRESLARVQKYATLWDPRLDISVEESEGEVQFRHRLRGRPRGVGRHSHEYGLAVALFKMREGTHRHFAVRRAWFMHARPRDLEPLERFFGTADLDFGCLDNGFAFDAALLALPVVGADARMLATVEPMAEAALAAQPSVDDFAAQVTAKLRTLLPDGANMDAVAAAMHMSARTLQRRLEQEGTSFTDVLDRVREELAKQWLGDRALALQEISWRLGFADLATFSRAFKRWTGKPPGTWRRG
jgi:AraC-like DNA-binding protein